MKAKTFLAWIFSALLCFPVMAPAQTSTDGSPFSGPGPSVAFGTVCTECFFPAKVMGTVWGGSVMNIPVNSDQDPICWCHSIGFIPIPGATYGMWLPQRIIETVRTPYHSPTMGANLFGKSGTSSLSGNLQGGLGSQHQGVSKLGFYNIHVFAYPFGKIAEGLLEDVCLSDNSGGYGDTLWASEIDPSWNEDSLADIMTPEAALFGSMAAQLSCMADAAASNVYQPIDPMFWCIGSWGGAYPQNGESKTSDAPRMSAYITAKTTAMMQRRAMINKTMGEDAVCKSYPEPLLVKSQFKLQQVWPNPEVASDHWFGEDPNIWGEYRYKPVVGEDFINVQFQFVNCCIY